MMFSIGEWGWIRSRATGGRYAALRAICPARSPYTPPTSRDGHISLASGVVSRLRPCGHHGCASVADLRRLPLPRMRGTLAYSPRPRKCKFAPRTSFSSQDADAYFYDLHYILWSCFYSVFFMQSSYPFSKSRCLSSLFPCSPTQDIVEFTPLLKCKIIFSFPPPLPPPAPGGQTHHSSLPRPSMARVSWMVFW